MISPAKTPPNLGPSGRSMWDRTVRNFAIEDAHQLELLQRACEQADRMDQCREVVAREGMTVVNRFGATKAHPMLAEERAAGNLMRLLLRELGLDSSPTPESVRLNRDPRYSKRN